MSFKKLTEWMTKKIRRLTVWDFSIVKIVLILIGMMIGSFIPVFIQTNIWYFFGVALIGYIYLMYIMFKEK